MEAEVAVLAVVEVQQAVLQAEDAVAEVLSVEEAVEVLAEVRLLAAAVLAEDQAILVAVDFTDHPHHLDHLDHLDTHMVMVITITTHQEEVVAV